MQILSLLVLREMLNKETLLKDAKSPSNGLAKLLSGYESLQPPPHVYSLTI